MIWRAIGRIGGYLTWLPVWVVIRFTTRTRILVICQDEVLVIQGWLSTGRWAFPGGGKHHSEAPVLAALRELQEETGIVVKNTQLQPLGLMRQTKGQVHDFYGFVLTLPKKPALHLQKSEVTRAMWVDQKKLGELLAEQHVQLLLAAWQKQR